jgi:hypothetical protein
MTKYLATLIGAAFIAAAATLTHAQAPAPSRPTGGMATQDTANPQDAYARAAKKKKAVKKKKARRGGMARTPTPPGTDKKGGSADQMSPFPRAK